MLGFLEEKAFGVEAEDVPDFWKEEDSGAEIITSQ